MNNWIDDKIKINTEIANALLPDLIDLKAKYPNEAITLDSIISELENGFFNENYLLEVRNKLRRIITKDEHNLIRKKDDIWEINNKIKQIESKFQDEDPFDFRRCFLPDFKFKIGGQYYYLKLPKLNVYSDRNEKSDLMIDRYIRDFLSDFLSDYEQKSENRLEKYNEFTIVFLHHITPENTKKYDTDNIEIKKPIDGINGRLIVNDTAECSDICQIIIPDADEYTEMFVIKGHKLGRSISELLNQLK